MVTEPDGTWCVGDDESESSLRALPEAILQQFLNDVRRLNPIPLVVLPECDRPILGLNEALAEEVFKNILEVHQPMVLELELDELSGHGLVAARHLMVGQPQFVIGHAVQRKSQPSREKKRMGSRT